MDTGKHDGKCEKEALEAELEVYEASETFMGLPEESRQQILEKARAKFNNGVCRCEQRIRNDDDFVRLWTTASSAPAYDKKAWLEVERQLYQVDAI